MTVAATLLTASQSTSNLTSYPTASVTPAANDPVYVFVASSSASPAAPTLTGNGLTWTQVATQLGGAGARNLAIFRGAGASPSAGVITIDFGGTGQTSCYWAVVQCSGVDTATAQGVVQSKFNTSTSGTSLTGTFDTTPAGTNAVLYGLFLGGVTDTVTPGAGYTELSTGTVGSPNSRFETGFDASAASTFSGSWTNTAPENIIGAIEIAATGGAANATIAWTEDDDVAVAAATETVTGTAAWPEDDDTVAATATETITGTAAWTEGDDTAALAAAETITGSASWPEDDDTVAAAATYTPPSGSATAAWVEDDDAVTAVGSESITGTLAWTEEDDAAVAAAAETYTATAAWTETDDGIAATASSALDTVTAWTEQDDTATAVLTSVGGVQPVPGRMTLRDTAPGMTLTDRPTGRMTLNNT